MKYSRIYYVGACWLCALATACGSSEGMREDLGLIHRAPDEYRVYSRPPLSVPPEFNLRPPATGAQATSTQHVDAEDKARSKVLGDATVSPSLPSTPLINPSPTAIPPVTVSALPNNADTQLLSNAGATHANSTIRQQIDMDNYNGVAPKTSTYLFGGKKDSDAVVDASKEKDRLQQDKAQNLPPTTGDTPSVAPKDRGILGDIF